MAVLQKIRKRSGLLVAVIGIALFAFIIGELFVGGLGSSNRNVGSVNGTSISTQEYLLRVQNMQKQGQNSSAVYNQIWNAEVKSILYNEQFEKLGLRLGKDQLMSVIQTLPDFANNPQFLNQNGQFDETKFNQFLSQLQEQGAQQWNAWLDYEKQIEIFTKEQFYLTMVKGGMYTTNLEAKRVFENENTKVDFQYVALPYTDIKDTEVAVSDEDIKKYINDHKNQFRSEATRSFEYAFIENKASDDDVALVREDLNKLLNEKVVFNAEKNQNDTVAGFKFTKNNINFVNENSDVPFDSTYVAYEQLPKEQQEAFRSIGVNEVYGPYENGNYLSISKVLGKKNFRDKVTASHILISHTEVANPIAGVTLNKEAAKAKAEQLLAQAKQNPSSFATLAEANTDDPGSKTTGGQYKDIPKGQMVPTFDQFIFSKPVGEIGLVETDFGYHIVKVDDVTQKEGVQLATISKFLEPSNATQDHIHMLATKFEEQIGSKEFSKIAEELKINAHPEATVTAFQDQIPAIGNQREAIQWAFNKNSAVGDFKRFSTPEGELLVKITDVNDSDLMSAKQARQMVEPILMRKKKAEILMKKITGSSLEEIAKATNKQIATMPQVTLINPIVGGFQEPRVVGTAIGIGVNKTSKAIEGSNGVYVVKTQKVEKAPVLPSYEAFKSQVRTNNKNMVTQSVFSALYQKADISDNRSKIFNQ